MSFIGSKCKNVKLSADFKRNVEIGPFGSIWKWIGVCVYWSIFFVTLCSINTYL